MTSTQSNWESLQRVAALHFAQLRHEHRDWHAEELFAALGLPQTALLLELAGKVGFQPRSAPTPMETLAVAKLCLKGIADPEIIAEQTGIAGLRVKAILEMRECGYGTSPYGKAPYGGNRKFSDGRSQVPRRITRQGQLSYRGHLYSLGRLYRCRQALVKETGRDIVVRFQDGQALRMLDRRHVTKRREAV